MPHGVSFILKKTSRVHGVNGKRSSAMKTVAIVIGGVVGCFAVILLMKVMSSGCKPRTLLDFTSSKDIWSNVERWAHEQGYALKNQTGMERVYQKGSGFWAAASCLLIRQDGGKVHVEAWSLMNMVVFKREIASDETRFAAKPVRESNAARINKLLAALESPVTITVR
jgi:hypothetical protein